MSTDSTEGLNSKTDRYHVTDDVDSKMPFFQDDSSLIENIADT